MFDYDLYKGCEVIVNYKNTGNSDIIDFFESSSNFEGYATLQSLNTDVGYFTIEGLENHNISCVNLIVIDLNTNEFEYFDIDALSEIDNINA